MGIHTIIASRRRDIDIDAYFYPPFLMRLPQGLQYSVCGSYGK